MALALAIRGASVNRHIRNRAFISALLFAAYAGLAVLLVRGGLAADVIGQLRFVHIVILTFGVINLVVTAGINPWRADRLPDHFPTIVQDAIIIALFAVAATVVLRREFLATTAVGAVVIGLALQETLGNLFAGLAIEIEKPFRVGHWVDVAGREGMVTGITWRATKIRTKAGNLIVVPNSVIARETITNFSEPTPQLRLEVEVGVSYDAPPNDVKAVIAAAIADEPLIDPSRDVDILMVDYAASAITYRIRVWTTEFAADDRIRDGVRSRIYYAFKRAGIMIPYPIEVQVDGNQMFAARGLARPVVESLKAAEIFSTLAEGQLQDVSQQARTVVYGAGERIVREGDEGSSMFVLCRGDAAVRLAGSQDELARLRAGDFFGEMSLLTGAPRSATVVAVSDCELLEITAEGFRQIVLHAPTIIDRVVDTMTSRRDELDRQRASIPSEVPPESAPTFLARVRRFLRLSVTM